MSGNDLPRIGAPATRALAAIGISTLDQCAAHSATELLALHGFGPRALGMIVDGLAERGLALRP